MGVQVGTAFAFCTESGLRDDVKHRVLAMSVSDTVDVFTDPLASPTGFPFKVLQLDETLSQSSRYEVRERVCDLGFLRQAYRLDDGRIGWRCPGERVDAYIGKGGDPADTVGRKCVCNALLANVGLGQVRSDGGQELPLVTCGDQVSELARFASLNDGEVYAVRDVIEYLLSGLSDPGPISAGCAAGHRGTNWETPASRAAHCGS